MQASQQTELGDANTVQQQQASSVCAVQIACLAYALAAVGQLQANSLASLVQPLSGLDPEELPNEELHQLHMVCFWTTGSWCLTPIVCQNLSQEFKREEEWYGMRCGQASCDLQGVCRLTWQSRPPKACP